MTLRANEYPGHQCRCVIADIDDSRKPDRCRQTISNPDQPVCDDCLRKHGPTLACPWLKVEMATSD